MIRSKKALWAGLLVGAFLFHARPARSDSFTWTGGGGAADQWSNASNWLDETTGLSSAPSASDPTTDLTFSMDNSTTSVNDLSGIELNSLTFGGNQTSTFTITGSSMTIFGGGISNTIATSTQIVSVNTIGIGAAQTWSVVTGSTLTVTSAIQGNGNQLTLGAAGDGGLLIVSGVISSTSNVVIAGTTQFSGFNTYSGSTTINGGFLMINSDSNLGVAVSTLVVTNGGTLQTLSAVNSSRYIVLGGGAANFDTDSQNDTFSGVISGAGELVKVGTGTLTLSGINTYTGGTMISSGTLSISQDANLGAASGGITISSGAVLETTASLSSARTVTLNGFGGTFNTDSGTTATFSGTITGDGSATAGLTKTGGGTLVLTGANTYAGGLVVDAGTLELSGGANNTYTGGTTVNAGTLMLGADNSVSSGGGAGTLTVASGATFDMNGYNQSMTAAVINDGTIDVHSKTLTLNGGYSGSGTLSLVADQATVTGTSIDFTGGTINVSLANPLVANGATFTPITATTAITGSTNTTTVTSPAALLFTPTYNATNVQFVVTYVPYQTLAATPNQAAVANMLEPLRFSLTGPMTPIISALNTLSLGQIQEAFDQLGPISLVAMRGLGLEGSTVQSAALSRRMAVLAEGGDASGISSYDARGHSPFPGTLVASAPDDIGSPAPVEFRNPGSPWGFFSSLVGTDGHVEQASGSAGVQPGYHTDTYGLTAGGDYRLTDQFAAGVSGAYLTGHADILSPASGSIGSRSARLGVYGTWFQDGLSANFYLGGAQDFFQTNRTVSVGSFNETATAAPQGDEINVYAGSAYDLHAAEWGRFSPFAGLNYDRLMIGSFTESGADPVNLSVGSQTAQSLRSSLGLKYSQDLEGTTPYLSAGWRHEFMNQSDPINAQLANGLGSPFTVNTGNIAADGAILGAGVSTKPSENTLVKVDYSGDFRSRFTDNALNASFRYQF